MNIQCVSSGAGKERAYSAVMRLASQGEDSSFDKLVSRLRKTAEDSANSTAANSPRTPSSPATRSGARSPEVSSAASAVCTTTPAKSHELSRFAERASSPRRRSWPQSQPRPVVASAPARSPKSTSNASPTWEFQSSSNATPARRRSDRSFELNWGSKSPRGPPQVFQSSISASPAQARSILRRRSSMPETRTKMVTFSRMVHVREFALTTHRT
jgi:hypothetical protein